ncbi:MAG: putative toxin-antitoxin system toxin component, PIN family [Deltaproteobacteria bacterium]|nr:putative toxin-antitoxin system toxin component, PIN family [Deltaproteobacteria bacterium]
MAVRAVIDTNIWVSSFLNPSGSPAKLRKAFAEGVFHAVISEAIIEEIADVLNRPKIKDKYGISESDIRELLVLIEERADHVLLSGDVTICSDKDDDLIMETAVKGKADYLVTGDNDIKLSPDVLAFLLNHGVTVVTAAAFLRKVTSN